MTEHPNIGRARRGYAAFSSADLATLSELIADDAVWHAQGVGPLSGDYHGRDQGFSAAAGTAAGALIGLLFAAVTLRSESVLAIRPIRSLGRAARPGFRSR